MALSVRVVCRNYCSADKNLGYVWRTWKHWTLQDLLKPLYCYPPGYLLLGGRSRYSVVVHLVLPFLPTPWTWCRHVERAVSLPVQALLV